MNKLLLYELDIREPVAELNFEGQLIDLEVRTISSRLPKILFGDVPVMMHLTCNHMISPMEYASENTGPKGLYKESR
jgi:hypothetical protein